MRVLTLTGSRNINVVLRDYGVTDDYDVILTNENYNTSSTISVTKTLSQIEANMNQLQIPIIEDYKQGDEYTYKVVDSALNVLFRGKIYFTNE